jgi:NADH pyrophosphatase NudC (nudix superfamily)
MPMEYGGMFLTLLAPPSIVTPGLIKIANMITDFLSLNERTEKVIKEYSLILYTRTSRLFSTVRRMKAEKELNVPISCRASFVIYTETKKRANEMTADEWGKLFEALSSELKKDYPNIYVRLFSPGEKFCGRCGVKIRDHSSGWWMVCGGLYQRK